MTEPHPTTATFTPDDEPYRGREFVSQLDLFISTCLQKFVSDVPQGQDTGLSDAQRAASVLMAQAINIAVPARELVRQGFLFAASLLVRPLAERAVMLMYFDCYPSKLAIWSRGWHHHEAPSLAKMLDAILEFTASEHKMKGHDITEPLNALLHARPDLNPSSFQPLEPGGHGNAFAQILDRPDWCDRVCAQLAVDLAIVIGMTDVYFGPRPTDHYPQNPVLGDAFSR